MIRSTDLIILLLENDPNEKKKQDKKKIRQKQELKLRSARNDLFSAI